MILLLRFQPHGAGYETRMLTVDLRVLLYLLGTPYFQLVYKSKAVARPGGTGARANGHKGSDHDGLRSLYHFRTLFHGTSAHTKEAGSEVAGVKSYTEKLKCAAPAQPPAPAFRPVVVNLPGRPSHFSSVLASAGVRKGLA